MSSPRGRTSCSAGATSVVEEHRIQGIGYGFIRKTVEMRRLKRVCTVGSKEAVDMARSLCRKHGLIVGISSGANMMVALGGSKKWDKVVSVAREGPVLPDNGSV